MKTRNIAGRHGAFTTQFSKQPQMFALCGNNLINPLTSTSSPPPSTARRSANKEVRTIERSRKAIERRLVLPLDEHNWIRALEVLRSRYARPGIKPEYYQRVLRAMVEPYINTKMPVCLQQQTRTKYMDMTGQEYKNKITNHIQDVVMTDVDHKESVKTHFDVCSNNNFANERLLEMEKKWEGKAYTQATVSAANAFDFSNGCGNVVEGIGQIRDAVFANEIPTCASLWITLIWAYVNMNRPLEGKETIELALRRFTFSSETIVHMLRLVYPPLCMTGEFTSVKELLSLIEEWQREHEDKKKSVHNFNKTNKHNYDSKESKSSRTSNNLVKEYLMTREAKRLYAEAAALEGSWQCALETMHECLSLRPHAREQTSANELNTLFITKETTIYSNNNNYNNDNILDSRKSKVMEIGKAFTNELYNRDCHLMPDMEANKDNTHLKVHDINRSKSNNDHNNDVSNSSSSTRETTNRFSIHSTTYHNNAVQSSFLATRKASKHICLAFFTQNALSSLLTSFCVNNEVEFACMCWNNLYGTLHTLPSLQEEEEEKEILLHHECNTHTTIDALPTVNHIHCMLNCLCANAQVNVALNLFVALFLPTLTRQRVCYESHQSAELPHFPLDAISLNIIFSAFSTREINLQELDDEALASTCGNKTGHNRNVKEESLSSFSSFSEFTLRVATEPECVIDLFNELFNMREDMQITDYVMAVVGPALVLIPSFDDTIKHNYENSGEKREHDIVQKRIDDTYKNSNLERLVRLLCQTPLLNTRKVPVHESLHQRTLKNHLMTLVYYCYFSRLSSDEVRGTLLHSLPHLFPPEYFCKDLNRLAKMQDDESITPSQKYPVNLLNTMPHHKLNVIAHSNSNTNHVNDVNSTISSSSERDNSNNANHNDSYVCVNVHSKETNVLDDVERMKQKWLYQCKETTTHQISVEEQQPWQQELQHWRRRERHHYFPSTSTARLTEQSEIEMKNNFANLYKNRTHAFHGTHSAANNDPRPIPKGIHDRASGWNFVGRNGEMMFSNNYRATNLLGMQPKIMRSLANPYRSWNPRLNSSLAHMELVKKWNKNSAM